MPTTSSLSNTNPAPKHTSWSQNARQQLKLIVPGALITYYYGTLERMLGVLEGRAGWLGSKVALVAVINSLTMIGLFLQIIIKMYLTGERPNWRKWRESAPLSVVIPTLTTTIILGWFLNFLVLAYWSGLGYLGAVISASGLHSLVFGILALIPPPRTMDASVN